MTEKKDAAIVLAQSREVISAQDLLRTPIEQLTPEARVAAWSVLDLLEKKATGPRKSELRVALLDMADAEGTLDAKGSKHLKIAGAKVSKTCVSGKVSFDRDKLYELMQRPDLNKVIGKVFKEVTTVEIDEEAVEALVVSGMISPEELAEVSTIGDPSYRLNVKKSKEVLALIPKE